MKQGYYESRYRFDPARQAVWREVARYLERFIPSGAKVLELGAGYCAFINSVRAAEKHAVDIFEKFTSFAEDGVKTHVRSCEDLSHFADGYFDVVFASNLLEHLSDEAIARCLVEAKRTLKPKGRLILVQPNFRYAFRRYFDDFTHLKIFTDVSLADRLISSGFEIEKVEPRFLPFSLKSRLPKWGWLVRFYLCLPCRPWAGQMLVVASKP